MKKNDPDSKCVLLGVTAGIAVYKAAEICSKLTADGYDVNVMMTDAARHLISERLFFTLSRNPVIYDLWDTPTWKPGHIEISERAKIMVIAPATANFIGKYANGIADDALTTTAMAFTGKVLLAPAMNSRMWANPAVRRNCAFLKENGVSFIGPETGRLACGSSGIGRMAEPADITAEVEKFFRSLK